MKDRREHNIFDSLLNAAPESWGKFARLKAKKSLFAATEQKILNQIENMEKNMPHDENMQTDGDEYTPQIPFLRRFLVTTATSLIVFVGLGILIHIYREEPTGVQVLQIVQDSHPPVLTRGGIGRHLSENALIQEGDKIGVPSDAVLYLGLGENFSFQLAGRNIIYIEHLNVEKNELTVRIEEGDIFLVSTSEEEKSIAFETDEIRYRLAGTVAWLQVIPDASQNVMVLEGALILEYPDGSEVSEDLAVQSRMELPGAHWFSLEAEHLEMHTFPDPNLFDDRGRAEMEHHRDTVLAVMRSRSERNRTDTENE